MSDPDPVPILNVEERLRVCLTLTKGLYHCLELAAEHEVPQLESLSPTDVLNDVRELTRVLRDQLLAIRAALPSESLSRTAPLTVRHTQVSAMEETGRSEPIADSCENAPTPTADHSHPCRSARVRSRS